jgi:DNA-binding HxlR family transcriptional regulator
MGNPIATEASILFGRKHMIRIVRLLLCGAGRLKPMSAHLHAPHRVVLIRLRELQQAGYATQAEDASWSLTSQGRRVLGPVIRAMKEFAA